MFSSAPHLPPEPPSEEVHLYGGPLDGLTIPMPKDTPAFGDQKTGAIYAYCPYATKRLGRTTFLSSQLTHEVFTH